MAQLPPWRPLDGGLWEPEAGGKGRVVAVVASEESVEAGWAAQAAHEIARKWAEGGARVILADGALHYPSLHEYARIQNGEGLTDAALYGASIGRVAKPVEGGGYFLIPAGTAVADANAVPYADRWSRFLDGFIDAGVRLLLFVRDGDSGCAAFLGSVSDIVVLAGRDEVPPASVRELGGLVRAVAGPGSAPVQPGARPPDEWTASSPDGRRRVFLLIAAVVVLVVVLVLALASLGSSQTTSQTRGGSEPSPAPRTQVMVT